LVGFILRRIGVSILILLAASFLMFNLVAYSTHPLEDLESSNLPNKDQLIAARIQIGNLDVPPPLRWALWIGGVAKCVVPIVGSCDLGQTFQGAEVADLLPPAMWSTVQMVTAALVLAILFGISTGILSAIRVGSGFDATFTVASLFLYSLPAFLAAAILKSFVAIGYNDFLQDPVIPIWVSVIVGILVALILQAVVGGDARRRMITFGIGFVITAGLLMFMSVTGWFTTPTIGPVGIVILSGGIATGVTALMAGLQQRRAVLTAGIVAVIGIASYFAVQGLLDVSTPATIVILAIVTLVVGLLVGFLVGGDDRRQNMRIGAIVALLIGLVILIDRFMQSFPGYMDDTNGRPIATVGSSTPGYDPDNMWRTGLDIFFHLLLPTISLLTISFAGYTRYARAGMIEVLGQDYVRTARAKGMPERVVVVRHAFRNVLIPITTLVATDLGALLGGAIITEYMFAIPGMGSLFQSSLGRGDLYPVMGYFLVIAIMTIVFNFLADLTYASLDPRVRVR
jgi:peptide/nickel transport system permease protein